MTEQIAGTVTPDSAAAAAASTGKTAETPEAVATQAATEGAGPEAVEAKGPDDAEADEASEAAKTLAARKKSAKERITELTRERRHAEREADRLRARVAELERTIKPPDPSTFDDLTDLSAAKMAHTLDTREAQRMAEQAKEVSQQADAMLAAEFRERVEAFSETAKDFWQVASAAPISEAVSRDILRMEEGPQVAYYLGSHPAEARALNDMSERERAFQLGRLASRLTTPPPRRVSTAPTPVDAIAGKGAQTSRFDPAKASMAEYAAKRKAGWKG